VIAWASVPADAQDLRRLSLVRENTMPGAGGHYHENAGIYDYSHINFQIPGAIFRDLI
jgi:hypothetical protein